MKSTSRFGQLYAAASPEIRQKAPILRSLIFVVLCVMPLLAVSDFVTGDLLNTVAELLLLAVFLVAYLLLRKGLYVLAARIVVLASFALLAAMTFIIDEQSRMYLYRSVAYYLVALALGALFSTERKLLSVIAGVGAAGILAFALFRLDLLGNASGDLISSVLVSEVLFGMGSFLIIRSNYLAWGINAELGRASALNAERTARLSEVAKSSYANMQSMGLISARVSDIVRLLGEAGTSVKDIEERVRELESATDESSSATGRIADRIRELNGHIEEESAAQIESSASINEMVASIRSVADSATRRRASMAALTETADEGMERLNDLLARIARIGGSIGDIQSMVAVINAIAGSTNLLSMNAAIEAAHAGDAGRGFAVVADEIRKLADTSGKNAKEIGRQLRDVVEVITGAVEESDKTKTSFSKIRTEIDGAMDSFREISSATDELAEGGRQLLEAIQRLNEVSSLVQDGGTEIGQAQATLAEIQRTTREALARVLEGAARVRRKNEAIQESAEGVAAVGEEGVRLAEELHRRSEAAGAETTGSAAAS